MSKVFPFAYFQKKIVKTADAKVSIMCKAIQYGLGCFSGVRGHYDAKTKSVYMFRLEDHMKRLFEGAKILGMKMHHTEKEFMKVMIELIRKNKPREDIYLRPTLYAGATTLTPRFDNPDDDLAIYMISLEKYFKTNDGLNVCISSYRRMDDDMISTKAKVTGGYTNSALAKTEAVLNGFDEGIFLNRDGKVCEASGSNVFGVRDGIVYTSPLGANILGGITRKSVIEILKNEMGLEVREESFDRSMLYVFDEVFLTGTAARIMQVKSVDKRLIGGGKLGKVLEKLQELFVKASTGKLPQYEKWLTKITV